MKEYTIRQIASICKGRAAGCDTQADSVVTDSRHSFGADETPLFAAIRGINHDGHDFIAAMYARGVRSFIVEREPDASLFPEAGFAVVGSSLRALQALAGDCRSHFGGTMIAVTGSSGKTTVKEWAARVINGRKTVFRSPRSYNSQLGVSLSIFMMPADADVAIIEAGVSRPGEMDALQKIIRPDIGIFTNIGPEHSANFANRREQIIEKAKLLATCRTILYGAACGEVGEVLREMYPDAEIIAYPAYDSFDALFADRESRENASAVATLAALLSGDLRAMSAPDAWIDPKLLTMTRPDSMRLDIREGIAGSVIVGDSDNTDINSLPIALDYLRSVSGGRQKMVILSDVLFSPLPGRALYERAAALLKNAGTDYLVGAGEQIFAYRGVFDGIAGEFYRTAEDMLRNLHQGKIATRAILIKGNQSPDFRRTMHALQRRSHTTVLEVNLDAMIHNLNLFRSRLRPGVKIMAMVKASAYGNGDYEVAAMLQGQGVDYLAVAFADEGMRLREQGITMPIVVLNADQDSFELMAANRLEPEIYSFASLAMFVRAVKGASESGYPIHIKFDTGMHRLGFDAADADRLTDELLHERETVVVRSVFSHLAAADDPGGDDFTRRQIALFDDVCGKMLPKLPNRPLRHILNSAGIERFPEAQYDMCRLGIGLYGCGTDAAGELRRVSRLATRIVQLREVAKGETVGYGRAQRLDRDTRLATIPVGYADGLDRHLGCGRWSVLAGGKSAPTVGRICMDSCMVDVTGIDVAEGDEVTVFGHEAGHTIDDMARILGTISYEVMTGVNDRVKRIFVKE